MAIVELDKITLFGAESRKQAVFERLQELGCVHLVDLSPPTEEYAVAESSNEARDALKYLRACPQRLRQVQRSERFQRDLVVRRALQLRDEERDLKDERDELKKAIQDLQPWGEFRAPADGDFREIRFWFFVVPLRDWNDGERVEAPAREISRDHRNAYVVVLGTAPPHDMPGALVALDRRPLSELRVRLEDVDERLAETRHERTGLTRWCALLASALDEADDAAARKHAQRKTLDGAGVYALQGWAPHAAIEPLQRFAADNRLALTVEPPRSQDKPPTLLHNPESVAGSEGLVTFYKTPEYASWDPSVLAYLSFAIFFAMIIADAGYGLIFALITACSWKKLSKTPKSRRVRNVLVTIVAFTAIYGIICGSYFGVAPAADSFLAKLQILDAQSQTIMMPLTIMIGVIHLSIANLATAWLNRGRASALASLGWVAVMAGATLVGMGAFADVDASAVDQLEQTGGALLIGGLCLVFLFSSERPLRSLSVKNHLLRVFEGLKGLTGLSGLFGDVLSYLRLFALGLSSAKLAETFNGLGASAWNRAGFGVIAAIAIVLLGHSLNILLGVMGGVVHGLRLNCIEFFKWCLPEEGYPFKAYEKKAKQP
ncbi:MAG: V-type ATP synthase subunit I [Planctomycetota bacterium]